MKRYLLEHRLSRRRQWVIAPTFHDACQQLGWYPSDTCLLKTEPYEEPQTPPREPARR